MERDAVFHVKRWDGAAKLFHVKQPSPLINVNGLGSSSLADTELAKDHVENVLDIDPA